MAREFKKSGISFVSGKEKLNNVINLSFCYPNEFDFLSSQYKIGYMPWESTKLWPHWIDDLNSCDEIWTTSDWSMKNLQNELDVPIFLYEHGIPEFCKPEKRKNRNKIFRFLHIGEPALRKNAQDVVDVFVELFGNNPDYQLIIKSSGVNTTRIYDKDGESLGTPPSHYSNILIIEDYFTEEMLLQLYKKCDAFIYPSYGEGFGFNSAYSIAMGMPTICTAEWAPYRDFITAPLSSTYVDSPWPAYHPGQMVEPSIEEMKKYMIDVSENYEKYLKDSWKNALGIHERFDWQKVSEKPIKRLKKINSMTSK